MEHLFREFWWLIFPIMGFVFAGFGMVTGSAMQRDRINLLRTYAEKGQTPPPELTAAEQDPYGYGAYGPNYGYGGRHARRMWRRQQRWAMWGPWWGVRRSFFFFAIFLAFAISAYWNDGHQSHFFIVASIIAGAVFLSSLLGALPFFWGRRDQPDGQAEK